MERDECAAVRALVEFYSSTKKGQLEGRRESATVLRGVPFTLAGRAERAYEKKKEKEKERRTPSSQWCPTLLREAVPLRSESA